MHHHDVIIVGARVAGAATAMLLARAGHRVLVLDRDRRGSDTLSTHALMRPAVYLLERWGLLDEVVAAGTPGQDHVLFHYGDDTIRVDVSRRLYAPRRTVLDPILVGAAERAGAEFRFGVDVREVVRDRSGRVAGVRVRAADGRTLEHTARLVVGADGRRSRVAASVGAHTTRRGRTASAFAYGYWEGIEHDGYEWCFRPGTSAGLIPTNDGLTCVFVGVPSERFADELQGDLPRGVERILRRTAPHAADRLAAAHRCGPVRGFPGVTGWLRRPHGPGWALVGDAGYFKDPTTAHGITDALRDAALVSRALDDTLTGSATERDALGRYEAQRDELSLPLFEATEVIAGFRWDLDEVQREHLRLSDATEHEVAALRSLGPSAAPHAA